MNGTGDEKTDKKILDTFTKLSGLRVRVPMVEKTKYMKSSFDLRRILIGKQAKLIQKIREAEGCVVQIKDREFPLIVEAEASSNITLYLNGIGDKQVDEAILNEFVAFSGLQKRSSVLEKTEYMKNIDDLRKLYIGNDETVRKKVKEVNGASIKINGKDIPVIIQAKAGPTIGLFLNGTGNKEIDQIIMNKFTEMSALKYRQQDKQQIMNILIEKRNSEGKSSI